MKEEGDGAAVDAMRQLINSVNMNGVVVIGGCDIYNPKALRAAMGSSLRISVFEAEDSVDFINKSKKNGMKVYASVPARDATDIRKADLDGGVIIFIGNEGSGLSEKTIQTCTDRVTIPMGGRAESFNASAAAAILAWELKR